MSNTFARLQLHPELQQTVASLGYSEPTPIQSSVIPVLLAGQDVIGQAKTGTGKTAAFALPVLDKLVLGAGCVQCLVLTPTRELAVQVARAFNEYGRAVNVNVLAVYGGQPYGPQIGKLRRGVDVVVGTPGRLLDLIKRGSLELGEVRTVVLDEADEMLSMGFIEDIEAILGETPDTRQTALFSATISPQVRRLADSYMHKPQFISSAGGEVTVGAIEQRYYMVEAGDRVAAITRLLEMEETERAIIFVRTRVESGSVADLLTKRGFPAAALNGDMNQDARTRTLNRFRHGDLHVLVATDVAARGLDIDDISHVINYELPTDPEVYVHRIGRTGRAGREGVAISLVTRSQFYQLRRIEQRIRQSIPRGVLPTAEAIEARRADEWQEKLAVWLRRGRYAQERELVDALIAEGFEPLDIAAAALKLARRADTRTPVEPIKEVRHSHKPMRPRKQGKPRLRKSKRNHRPAGRTSHESGMVRLSLSSGKSHGVRPNEVVATLAYHADVPGNEIGKILIQDDKTLVDVPEQYVAQVLERGEDLRIRRKNIAVALA